MKVFESLKVNPSLKLQGFYTRNHLFIFLFLPSPSHIYNVIFITTKWLVGFVGEIRRAGQRVGFEVVTLDGRTAPLASIDISTFIFSFPHSLAPHHKHLNFQFTIISTQDPLSGVSLFGNLYLLLMPLEGLYSFFNKGTHVIVNPKGAGKKQMKRTEL